MLEIGRHKLRVPESTDGPPDVPLWLNRLATDLSNVAKDDQGTLAARPVSTPVSPGIAGRYFYVTGDADAAQNGRLWRDTGMSWVEVLTPSSAQATNQRPPQSPEANLRVVRGNVNANGTIAHGAGFTIAKGSAGVYTVNFSTAFSASPTLAFGYNVGTADGRVATDGFAAVGSVGVRTRDAAGVLADRPFGFTALGPV
jgi:hypothetical protein